MPERSPDKRKLITWDDAKVRWLVYYYLIGTIAALYFLTLEEAVIALPTPIWWKVVFTTAVFPTVWSAGSVWFYKKGWLQ
jgi:hypothetical protein